MTSSNVIYMMLCLLVGVFMLEHIPPLTPGRRLAMLGGILAAAIFIGVMSPVENAEQAALGFVIGALVAPFGYWFGHYIDRLRTILAEREKADGPTIETGWDESAGPLSNNGRGYGYGRPEGAPTVPTTRRRNGGDGPDKVERDHARTTDIDG